MENEMPKWAREAIVTTHSTAPPRWLPCSQCSGACGSYQRVTWSIPLVWIVCAFCMGGGGRFEP